ncbi:MAG: nitroreductase family protein [Deltaproteobacteria bacterium]|nr:nitroreductase family protein [Deltaproteobacteria bacterium]
MQATAVGLGACWVGAFDPDRVRAIAGAPQDVVPVAILTLGHPAEQPRSPGRRSLDDVIRREAFSSPPGSLSAGVAGVIVPIMIERAAGGAAGAGSAPLEGGRAERVAGTTSLRGALPGWVIDDTESVRREAEPYRQMSCEHRMRHLSLVCRDAWRLAISRPDREAVLAYCDPLPESSVAALARLRAQARREREP